MKIVAKFQWNIFQNGNFSISRFKALSPTPLFPDGTQTFTAKGEFLPNDNICDCHLIGNFRTEKVNNKFVETFIVKEVQEILPTNKEAIEKYLLQLKGVGKTLAKKLVEIYGETIFDYIEDNYMQLSSIKGISPQKAQIIHDDFLKKQSNRKLFTYLYPFGIPETIINQIYKIYQKDSIKIIKENPYSLCEEYPISFITADKIATNLNYNNNKNRIEGAIIEVLKENQNGGNLFGKNIRLPYFFKTSNFREKIMKLINSDLTSLKISGNTCINSELLYIQTLRLLNTYIDENYFLSILREMHYNKKLHLYNDLENERYIVYLNAMAYSEINTAKKIVELAKSKVPKIKNLEYVISKNEKIANIKLSPEQENAVKTALNNKISIVTGGAGVGKTSVLKLIIKCYKSVFPNKHIALAAPTGKASNRMTEATGYPATTLHSLLQISADNIFIGNAKNDVDLLIIDEASMLDATIMGIICKTFPLKTQIVLVGDVDQLPSVGAGSVLKELINSGIIPVSPLTFIFRQSSGSTIAVNSKKVRIGETQLEYTDDFKFIETKNSEETIKKVKELYLSLTKEYGEDEVTLLTALRRKTNTGSNALNIVLQECKNRSGVSFKKNGFTFYENDRVMYTKNYNGISNGDVGIINKITRKNKILEVTILFGKEKKVLMENELDSLVLAYASTVHKSQGSEYKIVIMVVDEKHTLMLHRNLIYAAITRSKEKLYIVGSKNAFNQAILTEESGKRISQLSSLIKKYNANNYNNKIKKERIIDSDKTIKEKQLTLF